MTQYARGYSFERTIAGQLRQDGYLCVRAGGSHGVADVVALKPGQTLLIQAKIDGLISVAEWNELYAIAQRLDAVPLLAWRPKRGRVEYRRMTGLRVVRGEQPYEVWTADQVMAHG